MASVKGELDIHDWKSIVRLFIYLVGSDVLSGVVQIISHLKLNPDDRVLFVTVITVACKIIERLFTNYYKKYSLQLEEKGVTLDIEDNEKTNSDETNG